MIILGAIFTSIVVITVPTFILYVAMEEDVYGEIHDSGAKLPLYMVLLFVLGLPFLALSGTVAHTVHDHTTIDASGVIDHTKFSCDSYMKAPPSPVDGKCNTININTFVVALIAGTLIYGADYYVAKSMYKILKQ